MNDYELSLADIDVALSFISPDMPRDDWAQMAMALKAEFGDEGFTAFDHWSEAGQSYKAADAKATWRSVSAGGGVTIATLIAQAKAGGWQPAKTAPSPEEKIELMKARALRREKVAAQQAKADAAHAAKVANCAERSAGIWAGLSDAGSSDYLARKQVRAWGIKFARGRMAVPVRNAARELVGLQWIDADGDKKFLTGTQKRGSWHLLGDISPRAPIAVAEGYATAATIRQATGWAVAVAFDAGNLVPVVEALYAQYPDAMYMICADDDYKTEGNPGVSAATAAAQYCQGRVVVPGFEAGDNAVRGNDWNDLHVQAGLGEVKAQLLAATQKTCETPVPPREDRPRLALPEALKRYALAMPSGKVWDYKNKELLNKQAAKTLFGKLWTEWVDHDDRKDEHELDLLKDIAVGKLQRNSVLADAIKRFVYLGGTTDAWDRLRGERGPVNALRLGLADNFQPWLESRHRQEIHHSDLIFDPTRAARNGTYINMFKGLPLKPVRNDAGCVGIQRLVLSLCNENQEQWRWLMNWLALPLQQPGAKMATAVLMHSSEQGSGKSLFFDEVMRGIYGEYSATATQHQLEDRYTVWCSQKLYAVYEEIFSPGHKYDSMGQVKQLITGKTFRVDQKFVTGWEEANHMNCVFLSNEVQPMYLEEEDRRFFVVWPKWKLDVTLKDQILHEMANGGIEAFYAWLLEWRIDAGFNTHTDPLMTGEKELLIEFGLQGWQQMTRAWRAGELDVPYGPVLCQDFFKYYQHWCKENGSRPLENGKLTSLLKHQKWLRFKKDAHYNTGHGTRKGRFYRPISVDKPEGKSQGDWLGDCVAAWDKVLSTGNDHGGHSYAS